MNRIQTKMLDDIFDHEGELNDWEAKFVDDLYTRDSDTLTEKQNHTLIKIHHAVVFGGSK